MYKSRLQEYCQSKKWTLPEYSTRREGLDHCPQFKATVTVNGSIFSTPHSSKSSKEAQNFVAHIAYDHFIGSNALEVLPTIDDAQQSKTNQPFQAASIGGANSLERDDKKFKDMAHLYKNQLQIYAQKRNLNLPVYVAECEGPPHACRFKAKVMLEGKTYESLDFFSTLKDAENAAAKAALISVASVGTEEEDPGFFKNLLQELAQKEHFCLPAYATMRSGPSHNPIFISTVNINEESFTGQEATTKKMAEMNAAKVAYITLRERKRKHNFESDSPGYHVNEAPRCTSSTSQLIPIAESADMHISSPNPVYNRVSGEQVKCVKGTYQQGEHPVVEPRVCTNFNQSIGVLNADTLPHSQDSSYSSSAPFQSSSIPGGSTICQPSASNVLPVHKKIKVYPRTSNTTSPTGATVLHRDEKWIAVTMDSIHGSV